MTRTFDIVIERDEEGWYVGTVPALPGCVSQGKTVDQLRERMQEAIAVYLESLEDDSLLPHEIVGLERITVET